MTTQSGTYGNVIQVTATRNYRAGDFWGKGALAGIVLDDTQAGDNLTVQMQGVFNGIRKTANNVNIGQGAKLYVADGASSVNTTSSSRFPIGYALNTSGTGSQDTVDVLLAPGIG